MIRLLSMFAVLLMVGCVGKEQGIQNTTVPAEPEEASSYDTSGQRDLQMARVNMRNASVAARGHR